MRRTKAAYALAAKALLDHSRAAIINPLSPPADAVAVGEQAVNLARRFKITSILVARVVHDADWATVGRIVGCGADTAEALYGGIEQRWRAGDPAPWDAPPSYINDPDQIAADTDNPHRQPDA